MSMHAMCGTGRRPAMRPAGRRRPGWRLASLLAGLGVVLSGCTPEGTSDRTATPAVTGSRREATGTLSGRLGFPSEETPPMTVYVMDASGAPETRFVRTSWNQRRYRLDVPPGRYLVFAIPDERVDSLLVGAHTDFSPCNARQIRGEQPVPPCTTSPPREVVVRAGAETDDADIDDWYLAADIALNLNALAKGAQEWARSHRGP